MSEIKQQRRSDVEALAAERGLIAFYPGPRELFIDLDKGMELNVGLMTGLNDSEKMPFFDLDNVLYTTSRNGNIHVYVRTIARLDDASRIALQAALGSDPKREMLGVFKCLLVHCDCVSVLFETPSEAERVAEWKSKETF